MSRSTAAKESAPVKRPKLRSSWRVQHNRLEKPGIGSIVVDAIVSNNYQSVHDPATLVKLDHPYQCRLYAEENVSAPPLPPRDSLSPTSLSHETSLPWDDCYGACVRVLPVPTPEAATIIKHGIRITKDQQKLLRKKNVCVSDSSSVRWKKVCNVSSVPVHDTSVLILGGHEVWHFRASF